MVEFVLFCVPTIIYVIMQARRPEVSATVALRRAGVARGSPQAYGWAAMLLLPLVLAGWLAIVLIPPEVFEMPGVSIAQFTSVGAAAGIALRAAGEEVFFRGLLGGSLIRHLGFAWGNILQAVLFLIPHLVLLLIDLRTWPVIPVQFAAGWMLGWLRHKTGTFVPGAVAHALANIAAGLITA